MALTLDKTTSTGVTVNNAYCKVESISNLDKSMMIINIEYKTSADAKPFDTERKSVSYNIDGLNPIAQAYQYLKTLDEFSSAIDC